MILLQNNKLVNINTSEDSSKIIAIKEVKDLDYLAVTDEIREVVLDSSKKYNAKVTQCPFTDKSSLGTWYSQWNTKGEAISKLKRDGYTIYINDIIFN